jgi:hypothetical protein
MIMCAHHVVTLFGVIWAVILQSPGIVFSIMLLHDVSDVPLSIGKVMIYSGQNFLAQISLAVFVFSVTYLRMVNFPRVVYLVCLVGWNTDIHQTLARCEALVCCTLMVMHLLWEYKIFMVVYHAVTRGRVKDTRSP